MTHHTTRIDVNSRILRLPELLVELLDELGDRVEPSLVVEVFERVPAALFAPAVVVVGAAVAAAEGPVPVGQLVDVHHLKLLVAPRAHVRLNGAGARDDGRKAVFTGVRPCSTRTPSWSAI